MGKIVILGVFVGDAAFRAERLPRMGETLLGESFALGPGGKGSNQAVAAARAGGHVHFITKLGQDAFGDMGLAVWKEAGVIPAVTRHADSYTGAAFIFLDAATGDNAIIVSPGVAATLSAEDMQGHAELLSEADVFITQLEQPMETALAALQLAKAGGARTILNPAPAAPLPDGMLALCDYVTPNETEAEALTGVPVATIEQATQAAVALRAKGVGTAIITLGERGALFHDGTRVQLVPALTAGPVVETTGAGDAFNGGFATALAEGRDPLEAVRFGCATAGLSVTRAGAAASMPNRAEIEALLKGAV